MFVEAGARHPVERNHIKFTTWLPPLISGINYIVHNHNACIHQLEANSMGKYGTNVHIL